MRTLSDVFSLDPTDFYSWEDAIKPELAPEERLFLNVLVTAIQDYLSKSSKPNLKRSAANWLFRDPDGASLPSFTAVCAMLDIQPLKLRERLLFHHGRNGFVILEKLKRVMHPSTYNPRQLNGKEVDIYGLD